jgi:predicted methyltransferase
VSTITENLIREILLTVRDKERLKKRRMVQKDKDQMNKEIGLLGRIVHHITDHGNPYLCECMKLRRKPKKKCEACEGVGIIFPPAE